MTLDINITLRADNSLLELLRSVASCLPGQPQTPAATPQTLIPASTPNPAPAPVENPTPGGGSAPGVPTAAPAVPLAGPTAASPSSPAAGSPPPAPQVPTSPAPGYTLEQLSRAGAALIAADPGKREQLIALLHQFGVEATTQLPPEQYGAFATALRGMGAAV